MVWNIIAARRNKTTAQEGNGPHVTMSWETREGAQHLISVEVHYPVEAKSVMAQDLRIPLSDLVQQSLSEVEQAPSPDGAKQAEARKEWPRGDLSRVFPPIAEVYNHAIRHQNPPTRAVAQYMDVSRATASRVIAKARAEGYQLLDPVPYSGRV